jgi:very-short-patch-repair endonuclease
MSPRNQKNYLRRHLHDLFGNTVDIEQTIDEITSANSIANPHDYDKIINNLSKFRGNKKFKDKIRKPECDYVIKEKKIIIEYDERQHFSKARAICLSNYPKDVKTFFDKATWLKHCKNINAKDNDPIDRDETKAFYDSVRDIEAFRNGWHLIRFYHGEIDWESKDAFKYLKSKVAAATKVKIQTTRTKARILRLALKTEYNLFNKDQSATRAFNHLAQEIGNNVKYDYLVTPGGFIHFKWPDKFATVIKEQKESQKMIPILKNLAGETIRDFWNRLPTKTKNKLQSNIKFITFGVDSNNQDECKDVIQCIQFVALFDTTKSKVIHWTGKSYPTIYDQKVRLVEFEDLKTHFVKVNKETVCLLGCHDLKVFSPRAKAIAGYDRQKKIKNFDKLMKLYKPNLIIQHPHNTDTYKIWNTEWKTVEKKYPFVREYLSGIRHYNYGNKKRGTINSVIDKTTLGQITTIIY